MLVTLLLCLLASADASSHSEAPGTSKKPRTDISDLYAFMATSTDVAIVMNTSPFQRSDAGPNYSPMDTNYVYQIHVDNNGDALEDFTFQFIFGQRFGTNNGPQNSGVEFNVGGLNIKIALVVYDVVTSKAPNPLNLFQTGLNSLEYYRVRVLSGNDYSQPLEKGPFATAWNQPFVTTFLKPIDNVGTKTFATQTYDEYAAPFMYTPGNDAVFGNGYSNTNGVLMPGCQQQVSLFVGARRESFSIDLGSVFDLINLTPVEGLLTGPTLDYQNPLFNTLDCNTVVSFAIQIPSSCLTYDADHPVIGMWGSVRELAHEPSNRGTLHFAREQVSRLGNPLINELFIGLPDKDSWTRSSPVQDAIFEDYLAYPTFPQLIAELFPEVTEPYTFDDFGDSTNDEIIRFDIVVPIFNGLPEINQLPFPPLRSHSTVVPQSTCFHGDGRRRSVMGAQEAIDSSTSDDNHPSPASQHTHTPSPRGRAPAPGHGKTHNHQHSSESSRHAGDFDCAEFSGVADMLRLNTAIPPTEQLLQDSMAIFAGQLDGFPNGRRLGDDIVDIYLRIAAGQICSPAFLTFVQVNIDILPVLNAVLQANCFTLYGPGATSSTPAPPSFSFSYTDRSPVTPTTFSESFPFLNSPISGNLMRQCWNGSNPQNVITDSGREHCTPVPSANPSLAPLRSPSCTPFS